MNQLAVKTPKMDAYIGELLPPEKATTLFASLPSTTKPELFERNVHNVLMNNPELMEFHPNLIYREISKAAALGLMLDPNLGEGYIIIAYNYKTKQKEPQLRVGYRGLLKLARQSGNVLEIYCHEVHKNDPFAVHEGTNKAIVHDPDVFADDRGPIVGYYAVIKYRNGGLDFEPMSLKQCLEIRDRSDAWKAFKDGKIKTTPWGTDESEMCKKTNLRRLMKRQDLSPEMRDALDIEDVAEFPSFRREPPKLPPRADTPKEITAQASTEAASAPEEKKDAGVPAKLPPRADASVPAAQKAEKQKAAPKKAAPKKKAEKPSVAMPDIDDAAAVREWLTGKLETFKKGDHEKLDSWWHETFEPMLANWSDDDYNEAVGQYNSRLTQIEP